MTLPKNWARKEKPLTGSKTWPTTAWRTLLELALPALDEIAAGNGWTLGGGTALALKINHRISFDIDIFLEDAGHLRALSPARNSASRAIADRWQEPGHYLKLEREEGAIDFIVAARLTDLAPWLYTFKNRVVPVEEPAEILAKKLQYRGSRIIPRDIFDILAVHRFDPASVKTALTAAPDAARRAADRIRRIANRYRDTIEDEVNPTASGMEILEIDPLQAADILSK
jgi:nucleotidyltransferase AbiEii toxin of type IV toxin-antitoxin system